MINYRFLLKQYPYFFVFSISGVFFSAPGQTFLISLFINDICNSHSISHTMFASIYSGATLIAALMLYWMGRQVDRLPVRRMLMINTVSFSIGLFLFSISSSVFMLIFGIFFMRLFGQGLFTLTSSATTIKWFNNYRGTALSLTQLGYPLSEFIFPSLALFLLSSFGWRMSFIFFSLIIICLYYPISSIFIGIHQRQCAPINSTNTHPSQLEQSRTLPFVIRDPFFYVYLILSTVPPIMMTATLYFQLMIFNAHNWPIIGLSFALFIYALTKFIFTIVIGPIIDRYGCIAPFACLIFTIGLATVMVTIHGPLWYSALFYGLFGVGLGCSSATTSYLWARLYGSQHIAEIKGFIGIFRNGTTAIAPITFSLLMAYFSVDLLLIFKWFGFGIICMSIIPFFMTQVDSRL